MATPALDFDCLWCGKAYRPRSAEDIEAWAKLCPDCIGRAQENAFLRSRLKAGMAARAEARRAATAGAAGPQLQPRPPRKLGGAEHSEDGGDATASHPSEEGDATASHRSEEGDATASHPSEDSIDDEMVRYYAARAGEYDDWYLRRGRYSHGPIHDVAWQSDLDEASRWLDALPWHGEIVELAAGTGWWSPLLATRGTLWLYDAASEPLDRARDRLVAHGLRAHIHVRDAWAEPDRQVGGLFAGFWLSHVARERLDDFLALAFRWVEPGGLLALIDSRPDPQSGAADHAPPEDDVQVRRLDDGTEFRVRKVFYDRDELTAALLRTGFDDARVETTSRFFLLASARRPR